MRGFGLLKLKISSSDTSGAASRFSTTLIWDLSVLVQRGYNEWSGCSFACDLHILLPFLWGGYNGCHALSPGLEESY